MTSTRNKSNQGRTPSRPLFVGLGIVAAVILAAVLAVAALGGDSSTSAPTDLSPAPDVSFQTFEGETLTLSDFQGKPVVLNFFASWCPSCVAEMPDFETVHAKLGDDDVTFLGLAVQDDPASAQGLRAQTGITYQTAQDPAGELYQAFGGFAMPTTIFIDAAGNVVEMHSGVLFAADLEQKVIELLLQG